MQVSKSEMIDILLLDMFSRRLDSLEELLNHKDFKNDIKYHGDAVNESLEKDFEDIVSLISHIVNKFYPEHYEVTGFQRITLNHFESCLNNNLMLIRNCKNILKLLS